MTKIPNILSEIPDCPKTFFTRGKELEEKFEGIAIVGTRKASAQGLAIAYEFARQLSLFGIPIISGLAFGIDTAAHRGTLSAKGRTVAVLASGIKQIYPASNTVLAEKIISAEGSIVSEYEDSPAYPDLFLKRNRIISGLSRAVVIIEAPIKSGAIGTANWAAEQGREVFVVPGPITHPNYKGSHKLLRDGARLITSPEDILTDLGLEKRQTEQKNEEQFTANARLLLKLISESHQAISIDKIITITKLEPQKAMAAITELMIAEAIIESSFGYSKKLEK